MNFEKFYFCDENEKPLDNVVTDGGFCGIFRSVACVGDSLSSGEFEYLNETGKKCFYDHYDYSWGQFFGRIAGINTVYNFSQGGMTAKDYFNFASQNNFWDKQKAAQCYIIALGVNDFNQDVEVGSIDDVDLNDYNNNRDTFIGNYAKIIQRYKEIQPNAKFFVVTMPKSDYSVDTDKASRQAEAITQIAGLFDNIYIIDLFNNAITYDEKFRDLFYLGGHLNAAGYLFTAKMIASYIDYIIRHNMDDFRKIGLVGTPHDK